MFGLLTVVGYVVGATHGGKQPFNLAVQSGKEIAWDGRWGFTCCDDARINSRLTGFLTYLPNKTKIIATLMDEANPMGVLGIDCGKTGALAYYDGSQCVFFEMPHTDNGEIDVYELSKLTFQLPIETIIIEEQQTYASDGRLGAFNMGFNYGILIAWARKRCTQLCRVRPQMWQAFHDIRVKVDSKRSHYEHRKAIKALALQRLVALDQDLAERTFGPRGGQRDGIVDAILIAIWGHKNYGLTYRPTVDGYGCFADFERPSKSKGLKGRQGSKRNSGKRG